MKRLFPIPALTSLLAVGCTKEQDQPTTAVTGVTVSPETIEMVIGEQKTLTATVSPENATNKSITWKCDNEEIATVSANGVVNAIKEGKAIVTATTVDGGKTATCTVNVPGEHKPVPIDLGLSVKWASFNIGAAKPEEYGRYFAWGDVVGQTWNGSSWSGGGFHTNPAFDVDINSNLSANYDAAHVLLGDSWRMPTKAECQELLDNCTRTWTNNYNETGVAGQIFTSKKAGYIDRSIFLPSAGSGDRDMFLPDQGYYWSSSFCVEYGAAWCIFFLTKHSTMDYYPRKSGMSIRPVSK